jgi:hypothetical protein
MLLATQRKMKIPATMELNTISTLLNTISTLLTIDFDFYSEIWRIRKKTDSAF